MKNKLFWFTAAIIIAIEIIFLLLFGKSIVDKYGTNFGFFILAGGLGFYGIVACTILALLGEKNV